MKKKWCDICMEQVNLVDLFGIKNSIDSENRYCEKCAILVEMNSHKLREESEVAQMYEEDFLPETFESYDGKADEEYENHIYNNW